MSGPTYYALTGPLGEAVSRVLRDGARLMEAWNREGPAGYELVLHADNEAHYCNLCEQLFPEPVHAWNCALQMHPDGSRPVRVVLGICGNCKPGVTELPAEEVAEDDIL